MIAASPGRAVEDHQDSAEKRAIDVRGLAKRYGALEAIRGISFDVHRSEIFGLIGPDGAGKTSTFQILAGVMEATSGSANIFGRPAREMRSQAGYLTQTFSLYLDLTVAENIRYSGDLRHIPPNEIAERAQKYLRMFDMDRFKDRLAGQLSGGMKQKLALVCALVPQPHVLLLDEPTTGVDPVSRREFWDVLAHLAAEGLTILVATPYLDEAERCHRIALMYQGEIHQIGTPAELRASLGAKRLELRTADLRKTESLLSEEAGPDKEIIDVQRFGDRLDLLVRDPDEDRQMVAEKLRSAGVPVDEIRVDEATLENTFVAKLRALGQKAAAVEFPSRHDHSNLHGQVAIGATDLVKEFGAFTAVKNVSLQIRNGEVFGLLGANGAGKTTTIKMLCGLLDPTRGRIELAGTQGNLRSEGVRQRIGYMSQKFSLYDDMTIRENLEFFSGVYGVPEHEREEKIRWVLSFSGLQDKQNQITGSLPGGWKQRVAFGAAIMHEPDILFLDEPTSGVDPLARRAFWTMINRLADSGAAILVTTHYLEEAEQCNRLGMMVAGELVAEGTPTGIKARQSGHLLEFIVDQPQRAADLLKSNTERWRVSLFGERLHVITEESPASAIDQTKKRLAENGLRVISAREDRFSLEDVFIAIVEQARQQGKVVTED
ncbi:MAG: ABC-type multidrug transport system, ATPase component [Candidatus Acidoferrum typicum]|nr:ABC-type multidrug transport system, ATPase component [Candidatus Acidoferrum typicum]